jgi:predicted AlkP superfamily phosphohydrolase/phosphomutase
MDPQLLRRFLDEGKLPNCRRLIDRGSLHDLGTSFPPQSPVAWSNFISGTNPGGHGIFDFVARDPKTMQPYHSTARVIPSSLPRGKIGSLAIPLSPPSIENLRKGPVFWDELERAGVDCTILRMPAIYPPSATEAVTLSGMGTPDATGGYGVFTFFTDDLRELTRDVPGGRIESITFENHAAQGALAGPINEFSSKEERVTVPVEIERDPERASAAITIQGKTVVLADGEWSDWIEVRFPLISGAVEVRGILRMYLKRAHGTFGLYCSPVNLHPAHASPPISTPPDYARSLVRELGYFYTQGLVEDTHALSAGVLSPDEYCQQALFVHDERLRFFKHELARFHRGFLFYYFSTLDLSSHMFWRSLDPQHPNYSSEFAATYGGFLESLYRKVDDAIGLVLDELSDDDWLIVMSDHGFAPFRRQFNLNSWLLDNGYLRTHGPAVRAGSREFHDIDWPQTRAYGLGLNGLYLNRRGREREGSVSDEVVEPLCRKLIAELEQVRDPDTGGAVIRRVARATDIYTGRCVQDAPDLIVGYERGYRASWDTVLGGVPRTLVLDNLDAWSGDHCIDPGIVPGVLLSSRRVQAEFPRLEDLAPTILSALQAEIPDGMTGTVLKVHHESV